MMTLPAVNEVLPDQTGPTIAARSREKLLSLLTEAAGAEHSLKCCHLVAALA